MLAALPPELPSTELPAPAKSLTVEALSVAPPGAQRLTAQDVTFTLEAGAGLGIIGPSGCGKSSLIRGLVGVWPALRGVVRLDGAALEQWPRDRLGQHIGYLPQSVELIAGTVAQNIGRFEPNAPSELVIAAAQAADVHELILNLPQGYDTPVGANGTDLSAGQRQRIALARALFRDPFLVVLDEPNSNLDADGETALTRAILRTRERGAIVIVVAHRPAALEPLDQVLLMANGRMQVVGPKAEILAKLMPKPGPPAQAPAPGTERPTPPSFASGRLTR